MDLFLWSNICLEIISLMYIPLPSKDENRTKTLKVELKFQGFICSFWRILYIHGRKFLWNVLPPSTTSLEDQQLKQQCIWLVHVSARNSSGVHFNVFMCLNLLKCKYFQNVMCLFCRDGQRHMYGGHLLAHILLHSTRKVLLCGVDLSLTRKWDSLILVYSLLISHHVKSK